MPVAGPSILIVDDETSVTKTLSVLLKRFGRVFTALTGKEGLDILRSTEIDLVLLDVKLPDISGMDVLKEIKALDDSAMAIMLTAVSDTKTAVQSMKFGAYDYITKPFDTAELRSLVSKALEKRSLIKENRFLLWELSRMSGYDSIIGDSQKMKHVYKMIEKAAASGCSVLIYGESGTGKELVARSIHQNSGRREKPFVAINCAGIPDSLLESELFGHEAGAFTGALDRKEGKFELANGGSIFLDEIGSMSFALQSKILRVLQERKDGTKEIERIGSSSSVVVDVRVISATNLDLMAAVKDGKFREDLYYRLNVLPIDLPPLRDRTEDIPLLAAYFLEKYNRSLNKNIAGFDDEAMDAMMSYNWPGNVRELKNIIERVATLKMEGIISAGELPIEIAFGAVDRSDRSSSADISFVSAREELEKGYISRALEMTNGNVIRAAKMLGLHRNTLSAKINKFHLKPHQDTH